MITIKDLQVSIEDKVILDKLNLHIERGKIHALMGPNGAGKSTLVKVLFGYPGYKKEGKLLFQGSDITSLLPEERAHLGLFASFQVPVEIPGVTNFEFLHAAFNENRKNKGRKPLLSSEFEIILDRIMRRLKLDSSFKPRGLNEGFSGGEKKKHEILQMILLQPQVIILDEIDSGLDIDSMKIILKEIAKMRNEERSFLVISHYPRFLKLLRPDLVHIIKEGKIIKTGGDELVQSLEKRGFEGF